MKSNHYTLLSFAIIIACYSQYSHADLKVQCRIGIPHFEGEVIRENLSSLPIYIESDSAILNKNKNAIYSGDVIVKQGNRIIKAPRIIMEQNKESTRYIHIDGSFNYTDNTIQLAAKTAKVNLANKDSQLSGLNYQLVDHQGRGTANIALINKNTRRLKNATYTSCSPSDRSWQIDATEMVQYIDKEYAEMWNARLRILNLPILYVPYLQIPLGDRRRSGLLKPSYTYSNKIGLSITLPIYWNIAPNMDATFTPVYYSKRGWNLNSEFRYLTHFGRGVIAGAYMNKDRYYNWNHPDKERHFLYWKHDVNFLSHWRLNLDYTRVSDKRYFNDFDSAYGKKTDGYAVQNFKLSYYQPNYNFSISGRKFKTFDDDNSSPYYTLPQIDFNYYKNNIWKNARFKLFSQLTHFSNNNKEMPTAWRFHLEPTLDLSLANNYGSLDVETKLYATHYWQKAGESQNNIEKDKLDSQVTRILPQLKLNFKTTLEADKQLVSGFNQTLEPQIQYLYRPYKNQINIGKSDKVGLGYDSVLKQQDYFSIFSGRYFSGLDSITSTNQITLGATTRFINDKTGLENFNLNLGHIYFLSDSRVNNVSKNINTGRSSNSWSLESNWKFADNWNMKGKYQYNTRLKESTLANLALQYKPNQNKLIQLNYRFASQNYINQNLKKNNYQYDIKQIGATTGWTINDNLTVMTGYYYDLAFKKYVEGQFGFSYNNCCWKLSAYASRHLIPKPNDKEEKDGFYYDNTFNLNFELRFGSNYNNDLSKMLNKGIIPYTEAFDIN